MPLEFVAWLLSLDVEANTSPLIESESSHADFQSWFLSNGGYIDPDVELRSDPESGWSLFVKSDRVVSPDSTIISCPHKLALSWHSAHVLHFQKLQRPPFSQHVASRFFLMKQRLLGEKSSWAPYIAALPLSFNTPLYYDDEDMAWIRGTNLGRAKEVREDAWRSEYDEAISMLFAPDTDIEHKDVWSWELYLWAATVMTTRSFPGPAVFNQVKGSYPTYNSDDEGRTPVLIPGLDLLNHSPSSHVSWVWDTAACTIKTDELLPGGSEVLNNYGPKSNEECENESYHCLGDLFSRLLTPQVIMGYGFSLPNNSADHFSIGFTPAIAAYLKTTKDRRSDSDFNSNTRERENLRQGKDQGTSIHWVRIRDNQPEFSPYFLEDFSIAIENTREHHEADENDKKDLDLFNDSYTRNKLHVLCAVLMVLQKGQRGILKHSRELPKTARNPRQVDAARYRQTQMDILSQVLDKLCSKLRSLVRQDIGGHRQLKIVRLDDLLMQTPKKLQRDFRDVLNAGLKTRDPIKIRKRGGTDFAFTVWLCGMLLQQQQAEIGQEQAARPDSTFEARCKRWHRFLHDKYPDEASLDVPDDHPNTAMRAERAMWFDPVRNATSEADGEANTAATLTSYLDVVQVCVTKHPESLYNDAGVTKELLGWCHNVIRNEGVWIPNLQDEEEDDDWVLYLEC